MQLLSSRQQFTSRCLFSCQLGIHRTASSAALRGAVKQVGVPAPASSAHAYMDAAQGIA
jgi:hypothetical protein